MTVATDKLNALKAQLSHLAASTLQSIEPHSDSPPVLSSQYIAKLRASLAILSAPTHTAPSLEQIARLIIEVNQATQKESLDNVDNVVKGVYATELQWLFLARCTLDVYGCLLEQLFEQTLPLAQDIFYWEDVLSNPTWRFLFLIQSNPKLPSTSELTIAAPHRLFLFTKAAYQTARARLRNPHTLFTFGTLRATFLDRNLFRRIAFPTRLPAPLEAIDNSLDSLCRHEIETNLRRLRALRELQATGLGVLVSEGVEFALENGWKEHVVRGVDVMKSTMEWLLNTDVQSDSIESDEDLRRLRSTAPTMDTTVVSTNLLNLAQNIIPNQRIYSTSLSAIYGRPFRLVRYWPAAVTLLLSGSTILRILVDKRVELTTWARDTVTTIIDFWRNWVVVPLTDIISTIRHDDVNQIALMGRQSLKSDMDSLERMVVEFAAKNPQYIPLEYHGNTGAAPDVLEIVARGVREGDLSPVLRAYEADLQTPFKSALTGTLIQTLLIQVQKTKVDVEFALSGIDRLLKSQQLVFAFVGVTPSLIILYATLRYLSSLPSRRRGLRQGVAKSDLVKTLRNIERILVLHDPRQGDKLRFRDRGLLLCECFVAGELAVLLPRGVRGEFMQDLADLENVQLGVERQFRTITRVWRVWGKYLY